MAGRKVRVSKPHSYIIGNHSFVLDYLFSLCDVKSMAEIGVSKGRLMRVILRSDAGKKITDYFAIDPWENEPHWNRDSDYAGVSRYMIWFPALKVFRLESIVAAPLFPDGRLDLVYIDGGHNYTDVSQDIAAWLPKIRKGGIVCGHDFGGKRPGVERAVREAFGDNFVLSNFGVWYKILD